MRYGTALRPQKKTMNLFKRNSIFWAYFMLIASIALFIVSFALKFFPFDKVSVEHRAKELERQLHVQEKDIATVLNDTARSEEHTSEQSRENLVCRLLLE